MKTEIGEKLWKRRLRAWEREGTSTAMVNALLTEKGYYQGELRSIASSLSDTSSL